MMSKITETTPATPTITASNDPPSLAWDPS